jgi:D-alanine-D-alanine ligase
MEPTEIVVLFGGASGERRVSVASAQHVVQVLAPEVTAWFVAPDNSVFVCAHDALLGHERVFERDLVVAGPPAFASLDAALDALARRGAVAVLGFHGGVGEDGSIQRQLEARGVAFTGSGSAASARAFDKAAAKAVAVARGVPTAEIGRAHV